MNCRHCGSFPCKCEAPAPAQPTPRVLTASDIGRIGKEATKDVTCERCGTGGPIMRCGGSRNGCGCKCHHAQSAQPAPPAEPSGLTDYSAWLVERADKPQQFLIYESGMFSWTGNANKSIHFSRRDDAEQIAEILENEDIRICEHLWPAAAPSPAISSPRCPECLSDSRKHGNMQPCANSWHTGDAPAISEEEVARTIIQKVCAHSIPLAIVRNMLSAEDGEEIVDEEIVADTVACLVGDDTGCLDPDDPKATETLDFVEAAIREVSGPLGEQLELCRETLTKLIPYARASISSDEMEPLKSALALLVLQPGQKGGKG